MTTKAEKIKELREKLGWSTSRLADAIGVDQSTVSKYEFGKQEPKANPDVRLARLARMSYSDWNNVDEADLGDIKSRDALVVGELCAGQWREAIEWPPEEQYEVVANVDPDQPRYPLLGYVVRGTSMNIYYPDGCMVFVAGTIENRLRPRSGDHVIVQRADKRGLYEASLKEYIVNEDGSKWLWPRSYDPAHNEPLQINKGDEVTITGIVQAAAITKVPRGR